MIRLERKFPGLNYRVVYFPTAAEISSLLRELRMNELIRVRQTRVVLEGTPNLLARDRFYTVCIDLSASLEDMQAKMHSRGARYIRSAAKLGERLEIERNSPRAEHDFIEVYNAFAELKKHSGPLSPATLDSMRAVSDTFVIYCDGKAVAGHLLLRDPAGKRVRQMFGASIRLEGNERGTFVSSLHRYLNWHEIQRYKSEGFELFDFGGFESPADAEHPLNKFKLSFGAVIVEEHDYVFGRGLGSLAYSCYRMIPSFSARLRGRLPA
jgi:hypothetical protein